MIQVVVTANATDLSQLIKCKVNQPRVSAENVELVIAVLVHPDDAGGKGPGDVQSWSITPEIIGKINLSSVCTIIRSILTPFLYMANSRDDLLTTKVVGDITYLISLYLSNVEAGNGFVYFRKSIILVSILM